MALAAVVPHRPLDDVPPFVPERRSQARHPRRSTLTLDQVVAMALTNDRRRLHVRDIVAIVDFSKDKVMKDIEDGLLETEQQEKGCAHRITARAAVRYFRSLKMHF